MAFEGKNGSNWALILNAGLLICVILGAWFTTFSNPLNDKFSILDKSLSAQAQINAQRIDSLRLELIAQIDSTQKATALALDTVKAVSSDTEKSLDRRFAVQDKANVDLQQQMNGRFGNADKRLDEIKVQVRDMLANIEARRVEVATRSEFQLLLTTTRLEFLAELKRVDQQAAASTLGALSRNEFQSWSKEHVDNVIAVALERSKEIDRIHADIEGLRRDINNLNNQQPPRSKP